MIELAHCDLNVAASCNNRCVACSHASPFTKPCFMSSTTMVEDLAAIKPFLHFSTLQLVGGEPTLHPGLSSLITLARLSGVGQGVSVITNGRLLPRMKADFWKALDYLQLSIYPNLEKGVVELILERQKEFGFGFGMTKFDEFYLQFSPEPTNGEESFRNCVWKSDCYTIHEGYFYLCPQSAFFPKKFQNLPDAVDGLPLKDLTAEKLDVFLHRKQPFNACRICCGGHGRKTPWHQPKTMDEWIHNSTL